MHNILSLALVGLASRLGRFERQLLIAVGHLGADAYCAELARYLGGELQREVSMGQVSRSLGSLKKLGLLSVELVRPTVPRKNQRSRLVYSLTDGGRGVISALEQMPAPASTISAGAVPAT